MGHHLSRSRRISTARGPAELRGQVLDAGLCTACGMCLGLCPYIEEKDETVAFLSDCKAAQGRCWAVCPRTETDLDSLRDFFLPSLPDDYVLGRHRSVWMAQATQTSLRRRGQYGATVSALAVFGLETGRLDAALLSAWAKDPSRPLLPKPVLARSRREVLDAAGSKYTGCPSLSRLDQAVRDEAERLLVVGRPCQIVALRKRTLLADDSFPRNHVALAIGLFCMWSVPYKSLRSLVEPALDGKPPERVDIPKGQFVVAAAGKVHAFSHDAVRDMARPACRLCCDFTSELADLSVGSTEWKDEWNTLIVRSERGARFLEAAEAAGAVRLRPLPAERLRILREAAYNKKRRALGEIAASPEPSYLKISRTERDFFRPERLPEPGE